MDAPPTGIIKECKTRDQHNAVDENFTHCSNKTIIENEFQKSCLHLSKDIDDLTNISCSSLMNCKEQIETCHDSGKYALGNHRRKLLLYQRAWNEALERECAAATSKVAFSVQYNTRFGQNLCIVGSHPSLGSWSISKAIPLHWTDGGIWKCEVTFNSELGKRVEYKYIIKSGEFIEWEPGENHKIGTSDKNFRLMYQMDVWGKG